MQQFRNLTEKFYFKIFLGFIAVSFVMFGINSFIMGDTNQWVVKIGDKRISKTDFMKAIQRNSAIATRNMASEEANAYINSPKFQQDVLSNLIDQKRYEILGEYFNFIPDTDLILQKIAKDINFRDYEGKFDRDSFDNFLAYNGIDEKSYINSVGKNISTEIVASFISAPTPVNQEVEINEEEAYRQLRIADIINISFKNLEKIDKPSEDELKKFYEANYKNYIEPEKRQISYLEFSKDDLIKSVNIADNEIFDYYQNNQDEFLAGQTRDSLHLLFDDQDKAQSFLEKFESSLTKDSNKKQQFIKLAKEILDQDQDEIELNEVTREGIFPELSRAIFKLQINDYSQVVKSTIGYHIVFLTNISQPQQLSFKEVKNDIKTKLLEQKKEDILQKSLSQIDDSLLLSNSIAKTAQRFSLFYKEKPITINALGFDEKGKKEKITEKFSEFLSQAFILEEGQTSEIINDIKQDRLYVIKVEKIINQKQPELDEVKEKVLADLVEAKKSEKLQDLSNKIYQELQENPNNLTQIAKKYNLKIDKNVKIPREYMVTLKDNSQVPYKNDFLLELFKLHIGQFSAPISNDKKIYFIAKLNKIEQKKISKNEFNQVIKSAKISFRQEIMDEFNKYLTKKYGIKINKKALRSDL